jgi:hypothetical protein
VAGKRGWFAKLLIYMVLELGALTGVPMRPDQIVEMTRLLNNARGVEAVQREGEGDPPP